MEIRYLPYGRQHIDDADVEAVTKVLRSDWLTQGPGIESFEHRVATYTGAQHAIAVCNATAALHIACRALGVGQGDVVWTSPNTFVASANCALYCGANIDFVDVDFRTFNMSVGALEEKLRQAKRQGHLPKVVIPVDFGGQSCDMRAIAALAVSYGFKIIEDASHAVGGDYLGAKIGSGQYSHITVFSFHPVKIVTTGEGGIALTNDDELAKQLRLLRSHGITRAAEEMSAQPPGEWYYEQVDLGFNYRITDLQASLGESQFRRVDEFVARRRQLARRYDAAFRGLPVRPAWQCEDGASAYHLYVLRLEVEQLQRTRAEIFAELRARGIGVNVHYIPVHTQPYFRRLGFEYGQFPNAESYYEGAISLPLFFDLTDEEQDFVISTVRGLLQ